MEETLIPLFPLEVVLFPKAPLPLHIFEPRYKTMIGECVKNKSPFGVVLAQDDSIERIGCTAQVVNITRKYEDGRMDIFTVGKQRFEILFTNEEQPYLQAGVYFFDDEKGRDLPSDSDAQRAIDLFTQVLRRIRKSENIPIHIPPPFHHLSFRIATALPLELKFKQELLAPRSEPQRLERVTRLIEAMIPQLDRVQKIRAKSGGNGHTPQVS